MLEEIEKTLARKGRYTITALVIPNEASNFLTIEGPGGCMSSVEAFEAEGGFEDSHGHHIPASQSVTAWVDRNVERWYETADKMLEEAVV